MLTSLVRGLILPRLTLVSRAASTSVGSYGRVVAERRVFVSIGSRRAFSFTSPVYARATVTRPTRATPTKTTKTTTKKKAAPKKKPAGAAKPKTRKPAAKKKPLKKPVKKVVKKKVPKVLTAEQKLKLKQSAARKFLALPENIPPTRGVRPFVNFAMKYQKEHLQEKMNVVDLSKRAAADWNALTENEKKAYEDTAAMAAANENYEKWKASKTPSERRQINNARVVLGKKRIFTSGIKEKIVSGYNNFSKKMREEHHFGTPPEGEGRGIFIIKEIAKLWRELPDTEKAKYNREALRTAGKDT